MNVPGYDEAIALGYTLHSYAGDKSSANYSKGGILLRIDSDGYASLEAIVGLVELGIRRFSFPHPRFSMLEDMVRTVWQAGCEADNERRAKIEAERGYFG